MQTCITSHYLTLLLLASLIMLLIADHRVKIQGLPYLWAIAGNAFLLTLCDVLGNMCILGGWNEWILRFQTALLHLLSPLTVLLELYLTAPVRRRLLTSIPYCIGALLTCADLSGTRLICYFTDDLQAHPGPLAPLPMLVTLFYAVLLGWRAIRILQSGKRSQGVIVLFLALTGILTALGEQVGFAAGSSGGAAALGGLICYFYLAAICYRQTQEALCEKRVEREQQRLRLLLTQMQPHFIFNSLAAIQSLCYTDSEEAADCVQVFGEYLRSNINALSSEEPVSFASELEHIEQYVKLEKASTDVEFTMLYELETQDFQVPPLTVHPIVENAIKHGALTRRDGSGVVKIRTEDTGNAVRITVTDNGIGAVLTNKQKEAQRMGLENVKQSLAAQCGGSVEVTNTGNGAVTVITIPGTAEKGGADDVHHRR